MKKIFSKIVVIMGLMLSVILYSCSNNKNSFEKWVKDIQSEFTDTRYTIYIHDDSDGKYDFYSLYGDYIKELYDYRLEDVKKWKEASGINFFQITELFNSYSGDSKLLGKSDLIIDDFINTFVSKKIGDIGEVKDERDFNYKKTLLGHLCILKDGRKCCYYTENIQRYVRNIEDRVSLVFMIYE